MALIVIMVVGIGTSSQVSLFVSGEDRNAHRWATDQLLTEVSPVFTATICLRLSLNAHFA